MKGGLITTSVIKPLIKKFFNYGGRYEKELHVTSFFNS